jgi:MFS transporter, DHA2 family, multidrug resistance protein
VAERHKEVNVMERSSARWWALAAISLAVLAGGLDGTVLSVALPTLAGALKATETDLEWFVSGYLLVLAGAMLPAGLLGDRFGRKRVMLASLVLFAAGSVACAYAPNPAAFIAARTLLGVACAGLIVMALSALAVLFSEEERPRAVGIWGAANFLALPIGPLLGGWLLTHYWWGWVFLMNVPVALLGLVATVLLVPESRAAERPGLDPLGIVLSSAGLVAVTYGLVGAGRDGWTAASTLGWIAAGVLLLVAFGAWELRLSRRPGGRPLVDLSLFRSAPFTWGVILAALGILAMFGSLFTMPQYFQAVAGTDPMGSGARLIPLIAGLVAGALPADRIALRIGRKLTVAAGFAVMAVALMIGARTRVDSSAWFVGAWMAGVGLGMGFALATAASGALAELPEERSGVGAAVMQALQKLGGPFGSAILGSALASVYTARLDLAGVPAPAREAVRGSVFGGVAVAGRLHSPELLASVRTAFVDGMDSALLLSAVIAVAGLLLALAFLPARAVQPAAEERLAVGV